MSANIASSPLLLMQLPYIRALDPRSGKLLWVTLVGDADVDSSAPGRFFVTAHGVFVMAGARIWLLDTSTGKITGGVELPFSPDTAIFDGEVFYAAAVPEACAVRLDGTLLWKCGVESGMWSGKIVARDANENVLWETKATTHSFGASAGIVLGDLVSQPDDKGKR